MLGGESSVERLNENAHVGPSVRRGMAPARRGMAAIHRGMAAIHRGIALIRRNTASIRRGTAPAYPSPGSTTWKHVVRAVAAPTLFACMATVGTPAPSTAQLLERGSFVEPGSLLDHGPHLERDWLLDRSSLLERGSLLDRGAHLERGALLEHRYAWTPRTDAARPTIPATPRRAVQPVTPPAAMRAPYSRFRIGFAEAFLSTTAGTFEHDFSGVAGKEMVLLGGEFGMYGSLLGFFTGEYFNYNKRRLRVGDYIRMDTGIGVQRVNPTEVASEVLRPLVKGYELWIDLRMAFGLQANLLVTRDLEVGGVVGNFYRWTSIWDADFDMYGVPSLRGVRLRYRGVVGEYQTARSPVDHKSINSLAYERQDFYHTLRLRFDRSETGFLGLFPIMGIDIEHWQRRITKDGEPYVIRSDMTDTDASHRGTMIRLVGAISI